MQCTKCGGATTYKTGEKNGKKWAGSFCQNQDCKNVDWAKNTSTVPQKPLPKHFVQDERDIIREAGLSHGNAKNCASVLLAAAITSGQLTYQEAIEKFHSLVSRIEFTPEE